jgi:D-galactarolactone cycloisomerase
MGYGSIGRGGSRPIPGAIRRIEGFLVSAPFDPPGPRAFSAGTQDGFAHVILRITDADGGVGYGEAVPFPGAMAALAALAPRLIGADPLERDRIPHRLRQTLTNGFGVSAISIALDDLVGRRLGVPISALYGGAWRDRVQPYAASYGADVRYSTADAWVREAEALAARGFAAMKLRLGVLEQRDEARAAEELRRRAPESLTFVADGNGGFNPTTARAMGRTLHELGFAWFEEPMPPFEGYVGYPELAHDLEIPIAGGELNETRQAALALLAAGGVDIVQPDPVTAGGIGEVIFVGGLAALHRRLCVPHTSGGQIGLAAGLHALAALREQAVSERNHLLYLEYPALIDAAQYAIVPRPLEPVDGWIDIPSGPGLGIEIDDAALERLASERFVVE